MSKKIRLILRIMVESHLGGTILRRTSEGGEREREREKRVEEIDFSAQALSLKVTSSPCHAMLLFFFRLPPFFPSRPYRSVWFSFFHRCTYLLSIPIYFLTHSHTLNTDSHITTLFLSLSRTSFCCCCCQGSMVLHCIVLGLDPDFSLLQPSYTQYER